VGDVAYRVNLMSATLGALAIGGLYLIIIQLLPVDHTGRRVAAALAALVFAFGPAVWSQAVIAEVYAPNLAFIALTLVCLLHWERARRDRDFFVFALVFALVLGMYLSDLGFAPAFAVFILFTDWRALRRPRLCGSRLERRPNPDGPERDLHAPVPDALRATPDHP
jgi:4-amino-4-deoxy-L-arabinose transferase-like glycosyltransferase